MPVPHHGGDASPSENGEYCAYSGDEKAEERFDLGVRGVGRSAICSKIELMDGSGPRCGVIETKRCCGLRLGGCKREGGGDDVPALTSARTKRSAGRW